MSDIIEEVTGGSGIFEYLTRAIAAISSLTLFLMMMLTAVSVGFRYFLNSPVAGDTELIEFMMAVFVPLSIGVCLYYDKHISVEVVSQMFPRRVQALLMVFTNSLTFGFYGLITWQNFHFIFEEKASNMTSAVLLIPSYPFIIPIVIMGGLSCIVLLQRLIFVNLPGVFSK